MSVKRLGIYGGSFDPFHNGHKRAAEAFLDSVGLDKLLIMPTYISPHKKLSDGDDPQLRLKMLQGVFDDERIEISDYEIAKKGVSYTVDTLTHYSTLCERLFFLVGTDMLLSLDRWREPEKILKLCTIVCLIRQNDDRERIRAKKDELTRLYGGEILLPQYTPYEVSSTEIRQMVRCGEDISHLVPRCVAEYIEKYGLYGK